MTVGKEERRRNAGRATRIACLSRSGRLVMIAGPRLLPINAAICLVERARQTGRALRDRQRRHLLYMGFAFSQDHSRRPAAARPMRVLGVGLWGSDRCRWAVGHLYVARNDEEGTVCPTKPVLHCRFIPWRKQRHDPLLRYFCSQGSSFIHLARMGVSLGKLD